MNELMNFNLSLGGRRILRDITLRPKHGELLALCGPNGAGKTSILRALAGVIEGSVAPDPRRTAYLPQNAMAAWPMTVGQIAALGRIPHGDHATAPVEAALRLCGIVPLRDARIDRISGGEARRAMLARIFATEPDMFLLDEPAAGLDPAASHAILRLLRDTAVSGTAVVVVLHAIELAVEYAHRIVLVDQGRIVESLPAEDALSAAAAIFGMRAGLGPRLMIR